MTTYSVQLDSRGHEVDADHSTSVVAESGSFDSISVRDTRSEKLNLWSQTDPVAAEQHQVEILKARVASAEEFAFSSDVFDKKTGKPRLGHETEVARRSAIARQLRESAGHDVDMANARLREADTSPDAGGLDLIRELEEQQKARAAAANSKMARRV